MPIFLSIFIRDILFTFWNSKRRVICECVAAIVMDLDSQILQFDARLIFVSSFVCEMHNSGNGLTYHFVTDINQNANAAGLKRIAVI